MIFDWQLIFASVPEILVGLRLTMELLVLSALLGTLLGLLLMLMRMSRFKALAIPVLVYIYIFRGTPILVQIFIIYHGLPQFDSIRDSLLWPILREPFGCAVLALTLNSAAYFSEIFRGAMLGVDRGLVEASKALGLSPVHRLIYIEAPIAIRLAIPTYSNDIVSLLKSTALASTITLLDMTGIARTIVAQTYAPYEIFISLAIIYLVMTYFIQTGFGRFERYMSRHLKGNN